VRRLTTAATEVLVVVKCLPKVIDGLVARSRTGVNQNANFGLEQRSGRGRT